MVIRGAGRTAAVAGFAIVMAACQAAPAPTPPSSTPLPTASVEATPTAEITPTPRPTDPAPSPTPSSPALTEADGVLPERVTVFDDEYPGIANLDADLLDALREAADDAAEQEGITFRVNSGWRSPAYQDQLLQEAVAEYGSEEEAARWVATAENSPHVSGDAVDIAPPRARTWLSEHGAGYGLCQIYRNEPWHFELRPRAIDDGCPQMYANPTQDPRMQ